MHDRTQDMLDLYDRDDYDLCPVCGNPLTGDEDGDGVMTMPVQFCEHCPEDATDGEAKAQAQEPEADSAG